MTTKRSSKPQLREDGSRRADENSVLLPTEPAPVCSVGDLELMPEASDSLATQTRNLAYRLYEGRGRVDDQDMQAESIVRGQI